MTVCLPAAFSNASQDISYLTAWCACVAGASDEEYDPDEHAMDQEEAEPDYKTVERTGDGSTGTRRERAHGGERVRSHRDERGQLPRERRDRRESRDEAGGRGDRVPRPGGALGREGGWESRRLSDIAYSRERGDREAIGPSRNDLPAAGGAAASRNLQHRAFVMGVEGGTSWIERTLLHDYFSVFGQVMDVFTPNGKSVAYITFETAQNLQRALDAQQHVVSGCTVRLIRAEKVQVALFCLGLQHCLVFDDYFVAREASCFAAGCEIAARFAAARPIW